MALEFLCVCVCVFFCFFFVDFFWGGGPKKGTGGHATALNRAIPSVRKPPTASSAGSPASGSPSLALASAVESPEIMLGPPSPPTI